ncbi:hypothetical protein B9T62_14020 [Paenibacillus donghaensis]|uniref:Uncharacterized protein n=2 Tax=Paenibacillus donghaensis TaxID=414771 RepID=A0A2Z2KHW6_9BACL|nr:hypothetical protein B9T62_14020 [Paenibacillus donghaensis]
MIISTIAILTVISSGCGSAKDNASVLTTAQVSPSPVVTASPAPSVAPTASPTPAPAEPAAKSVSLFQSEVPVYDGMGISYVVNDEQLDTEFKVHQTLPLAVFMPVTMERFEREQGTAWGTADKQNYLILYAASDKSADQPTELGSNPVLAKYKEYIGSYSVAGRTVELFAFKAQGKDYTAEISTTPDQQETLFPVFRDMLSYVQYMEKLPPLKAGITAKTPDVGNSSENKQILQELMKCLGAIVAKDKQQFNETMYSDRVAEGLAYHIDNNAIYRFTRITFNESVDSATNKKRVSFNVEFERMTEEGYFSEQSLGIPLLKNKQGVWKIADMD